VNIQHWQNNYPVAQAVEGGCHVYWYAQDKFIRSHTLLSASEEG